MKLRENASFLPLFWIWKSTPFATSSLPSSSKYLFKRPWIGTPNHFLRGHAPQKILNFAIACEFCNLIIWQITPSTCFTHWLYTGTPKTILLHASAPSVFEVHAKHSYSGISAWTITNPAFWLAVSYSLSIGDSWL